MYAKEDLLARLQNGEDISAIADEMAAALNEAQKEHEEKTKKLEAEIAEAARVRKAKREAVHMILDGFTDYLIAVGEDELQNDVGELVIDDVVKAFDSAIIMAKRLKEIESLEFADEAVWSPLFKSFGFDI